MEGDMVRPEVWILRLGHRIFRDKRITTHLALAARSLGAKGIFIQGDQDEKLRAGIQEVVENWGGHFKVEFVTDWQAMIKKWKDEGSSIVHLTMYGLPFEKYIDEVRKDKSRILLMAGGKKVPREAYQLADLNLAVTGQPHSEISAVSLFLDRLYEGKELELRFENPKFVIAPSPRGKVLLRRADEKKARTKSTSNV